MNKATFFRDKNTGILKISVGNEIYQAIIIQDLLKIPQKISELINLTDYIVEPVQTTDGYATFRLRSQPTQVLQGGGRRASSSTSSGNWTVISEAGIIAFAGGGQANATQLTTQASGYSYNRVDTAAAPDASVKPSTTALVNMEMRILNRAGNGNAINVYPFSGDRFMGVDGNLMAIDAPFSVADENQLCWFCYEAGVLTIQ